MRIGLFLSAPYGSILVPVALLASVLLTSCDSIDESPVPLPEVNVISDLSILLNPTGYAPLSAELTIKTTRPVLAEVVVQGKDGNAADVAQRFDEPFTEAVLPVLGLYIQRDNTVIITLFDEDGTELVSTMETVTTLAPSFVVPDIEVIAAVPSSMKPGMNLVSYFGRSKKPEANAQIPFIFDTAGDIRWYLDMAGHPSLSYLFYDVGVERLTNGNLYFGDGASDQIVEMNMLGHIINRWPMAGYGFHHNVYEMEPDGNLLATVNKDGLLTIEDHIIEIDRTSGQIANVWDLRQSMDETRYEWAFNVDDWFHANGMAYDETKDAIIVSGRFQGVIKLTRNNELMWILAPHISWETSGDGTDLSTKLLQPLDSNGNPIVDEDVINGNKSHPDFEWSWYPHAPELTPHGTLLVFDNGLHRHKPRRLGRQDTFYSRAVEYEIDDEAMTVRQVWQYGKERKRETYSAIVSDVDFHVAENNVAFMPGSMVNPNPQGRIVEVDYQTKAVVFEALVTPKPDETYITFHRIERLPLYPPNH